MKIAYLMNTYPLISTTFIRREIAALEGLGVEVNRYAVRYWDEKLVDPLDIADQAKTHYLLTNNYGALFLAFFSVLFFNFVGMFRAFCLWLKVCKNAGGISIRHVAYLLQAAYFFKQTAKDNIQHVHAHFSTNSSTVAMLAHEMGGASYSFTAHGPDEFVDPSLISMKLKVQHAAFVVAISNFCRVQLVYFSSYEYWDKIMIAHCGLNIADFNPNFEFDENNQSLICIGRLCPQKAQVLIPQALSQLKNEFPKLMVNFIGDGESRPAVEAAIKQFGVESMATLHGWKANSEVRTMLLQSRALLLPSFAEGLPVVIMESLALGRPVISTYIAGIPELVDAKCGWMIPAGSVDDMVIAIRSALLASPSTLSSLGREGRQRIEAEHDIDKIAKQLQKQFTLAIENASS